MVDIPLTMLSFSVNQADLLQHTNAIGISDVSFGSLLVSWHIGGVWLLQQISRMLFCLGLNSTVQLLGPYSMYWILVNIFEVNLIT